MNRKANKIVDLILGFNKDCNDEIELIEAIAEELVAQNEMAAEYLARHINSKLSPEYKIV